MVQKPMGLTSWGMLLGLSVLWGGSFFFMEVAVRELPTFTFVVLRVGLAAAVLLTLARLMGLALPRGRTVWAAFFCMGVLNNLVPFCLIAWGETRIAGGLASILNATTPLFAVVVAHMLTDDEKISVNKIIGVVVGFVGVAVMIGPTLFDGMGGHVWAQVAVLGAALSYSFAGIFGKRFKKMGVPPMLTAAGQLSASTVMLLPVALLVDRPWTIAMPDLHVWGAVLGIALLSTALAYVVYFRALAAMGATNVMLVTFLIPVTAILLSWLVLGEHLAARDFVGMAFIALGLAAIDGRLVNAWRREQCAEVPSR
ncbi:MAG TPA: DMT family transporter [Burkholderiaceae bacterium]|nr:DMT family transporter [Burkholderiaceae bacterium]